MADEWKKTLSLYVNEFNQDEVDYRVRSESTLITDLDYLMRRGEQKRRLESWYQGRGAVPLRCETRARLLREIENREGELEVEMLLAQKVDYEKGGARHQEERIVKQRLTLQREGDEWSITRVIQPVPERSASAALPAGFQSDDSGGKSRTPRPFLNREVLGGGGLRSSPYRREDAVLYADRWWDGFNPEFAAFEVDCTNYISQCLFAGGGPINYTGKRESGWWYKGYVGGREAWSYSWSVANALERFLANSGLGLRGELVSRPEQLELGDVIIYDWDGNGSYQHSTIVTAFDAGGMPLVNAHTVPSKHRYWDYRDSYAWNENTVYRFFHIADRF
ncbi:putative amidase-like protein [Fontibacillus phaseoli]|uniref:Putative amidase-like protein n=1 Tax=Fontibacillus phaseoli TaxID=1416533 RepID=A0A369B4K5_9BACL|nr:amidase domain-containing protein [Fontibacillus phaseoli]RCX16225.1 putative amidase-like protein [Fontibacillus phaseoli]